MYAVVYKTGGDGDVCKGVGLWRCKRDAGGKIF